LPGYPASHGCVRLPYEFAASLFDVTELGLRVIVVPNEAAPAEIAHPILFQSKPADGALAVTRTAERRRRDGARQCGRSGAAGHTPARAGLDPDQPQDTEALCPAILRAHL
jgi:hypothetical protein